MKNGPEQDNREKVPSHFSLPNESAILRKSLDRGHWRFAGEVLAYVGRSLPVDRPNCL